MHKGTSLYLDLVRFFAAFSVFAFHASPRKYTAGLLWRFGDMGTPAVSVFFVLSGFVIAYVLATREQTLLEFGASRFGRLYSVVLPALALTIACNSLDALSSSAPTIAYEYNHNLPLVRYLASGLFINRAWVISGFHGLEPGANIPFWSLSYEVSYYVAIGLIVFGRGTLRIVFLLLLCLLMGPTAMLLAPIWFLGYVIYRWQARLKMPLVAALAAFILGLSLYLISDRFLAFRTTIDLPALAPQWGSHLQYEEVGNLLCRYVAAAGFAINLVGFINLSPLVEPILSRFSGSIRWLGSLTFSLYLFHFPLLAFVSTYRIAPAGSISQALWTIGGVLLIVATLGRLCEKSKGVYKKTFFWIFTDIASADAGTR